MLILPRIISHVPRLLQERVSEMGPLDSNVYSRAERTLLTWLNHHQHQQRRNIFSGQGSTELMYKVTSTYFIVSWAKSLGLITILLMHTYILHYEGGNGWDVHTHFYYYMYLLCPAANPQKQCSPIKILPLNFFFLFHHVLVQQTSAQCSCIPVVEFFFHLSSSQTFWRERS